MFADRMQISISTAFAMTEPSYDGDGSLSLRTSDP